MKPDTYVRVSGNVTAIRGKQKQYDCDRHLEFISQSLITYIY